MSIRRIHQGEGLIVVLVGRSRAISSSSLLFSSGFSSLDFSTFYLREQEPAVGEERGRESLSFFFLFFAHSLPSFHPPRVLLFFPPCASRVLGASLSPELPRLLPHRPKLLSFVFSCLANAHSLATSLCLFLLFRLVIKISFLPF